MGNIIWLASYQKSGNTWVRAFLHNLFLNAGDALSLPRTRGGEISASARGVAGGWRDTLTPEQAGRIEQDHAEQMARFGYEASQS